MATAIIVRQPAYVGNRQCSFLQLSLFPSTLGWMAVAGRGRVLSRLWFGYRTKEALLAAVDRAGEPDFDDQPWETNLVERLQAYADGVPDDFVDVEIDKSHLTPFARRVVLTTRRIAYGRTCSYGELARQAGCPNGARAVGNVMRQNRVPLVVPCHRVVGSAGKLGGFSGEEGLAMKRRLLDLEAGNK